MSLSTDSRINLMKAALAMMLDQLGTKAINSDTFHTSEAPFASIPPAIWRELEGQYLTRPCDTFGDPQCQLTGSGWYQALEMTGRLTSPIFVEKVSKITATMKDAVKGRQQDGYLTIDQLASKAGLPEDLVYNVVESRLIGRLFRIHDAEWEEPGLWIRIPLTFGLPPL